MSSSAARRERRLERYRAERVTLRKENEELRAALTEAVGLIEEHDQSLTKLDPDGLRARISELESAIREGSHRAAWEDAARQLGVRQDLLEDLWKLDPPDTSGDKPDPKAIARHLKASIKARPMVLDETRDDETDEGTEATDDDESEGDDETDEASLPALFRLAPRSARKPALDDDETDDAAPRSSRKSAPARTDRQPPDKAGMSPGPGVGRGRRDTRSNTVADQVDREFRESGRSDPFRI